MGRGIEILLLIFLFFLLVNPAGAEYPKNAKFTNVDSGVQQNYEELLGQTIVIEGFATWCEPCKKEMEELAKLEDAYSANLSIASISVSPATDDISKIKEFRKRVENSRNINADWLFGLDQDIEFRQKMQIKTIPTTFVFDADGNELKRWEKPVSAQEISSYIDANVTLTKKENGFTSLSSLRNNPLFQITVVAIVLQIIYRFIIPSSTQQTKK